MSDAAQGLAALRALILQVASENGIAVEEATRWGQHAFVAPKGCSLRIGVPRDGRGFALFTHCRTPLIGDFRDRTGDAFRTEGTRAVLFDDVEDLDGTALAPLILGALTYHERTS